MVFSDFILAFLSSIGLQHVGLNLELLCGASQIVLFKTETKHTIHGHRDAWNSGTRLS
jgi:hypothetical protein